MLDLNDVVNGLDRMLRQLVGDDIELTLDCDPGIGRVRADAGQLGQVLMNLVVNARDAMPDGGRLRVATSTRAHETDGPINRRSSRDHPIGDCAVLTVVDTGTGIPDDVRGHLFEPFFSTKSSTRGTGLGLATCQNIVTHSGGIDVISKVGEVRHSPYFATGGRSVPDAWPHLSIEAGAFHGTETLLLVEDEPSVRRLRALRCKRGYRVLSAANGQGGCAWLANIRDLNQLVITDVVMPVMSGRTIRVAATSFRTFVLFRQDTRTTPSRSSACSGRASTSWRSRTAGDTHRQVREMLEAHSAIERASVEHTPCRQPCGRRRAGRPLRREGYRVTVENGDQRRDSREGGFRLHPDGPADACPRGHQATAESAVGAEDRRAFDHRSRRTNCRPRRMSRGRHGWRLPTPVRSEDFLSEVAGLRPAPNRPLEGSAHQASADATLDEERLLQTVEGDRELMGELAALFLDDAPNHIATIRAAIAGNHASQLKAAAHALKGAAATLAAGRVSAAAQKLETLGASGAVGEAGTALVELDDAFARLRDRLAVLGAST